MTKQKKGSNDLATAVHVRRVALGLSHRALADQTGVSFATLARLERGVGAPDANTQVRLLSWLEAHSTELPSSLEQVAEVHFRAGKNIDSRTVAALVAVAQAAQTQFSEAAP